MQTVLKSKVPLAVLAAAAYFLSSRIAYALAIPGGVVSLWLPSGVMLALFLLVPRADWPALFAAALAGSVASDLLQRYPTGFVVAAALANALQCAGIAWLISWRLPAPATIVTPRNVLESAALVVLGTAAFAVLGGVVMALWFPRPFPAAWLVWLAGDGLAILIVTPALLVWRGTRQWLRTTRPAELAQGAALIAALAMVALVVLGTRSVWSQPYMVLPLLFAATIRLGLRGAALGNLTVAAIATWNAALGQGPFIATATTPIEAALSLYAYLGFASLSSFMTAAVLEERASARRQLLDNKERTSFALQAAGVGLWEVNLRTGEAFWSETCEMMHGLRAGTFGKTFDASLAVVHPDDVASVRAELKRALDTRTEAVIEYRVSLPDGSEHRIRSRGNFIYDDDGVPARGAGVAIDLTQQRDLEDQLRQSRKMEVLGQLAAGVAHDFNNILTVIQGYGTIVQEQCPPGSAMREDVDELLLGAHRAESLTRQLLAFSRRQILAPKIFDLSQLLKNMQPMLTRLLGEHVAVKVAAPVGMAYVKTDPGQMEQVVLNLVVNARDAMPSGGTLEIEVAVRDRTAELSVRDTGIGMSPLILERIFEPFYTTKQAGKGTGLGLATVHGIVQQSGGRIEVRSTPGKGTSFTVTLPLEEAVAASPTASVTGARAQSGETILVVEDDPELRRLTLRILREAGYDVRVAGSSDEAVRIASDPGRLDLLLTDVVLPGMNGRQVAEAIARVRPGLPVLYMSGYTDDEVMLRGVQEKGMSLVQKPFEPNTLLQRIRETMDRGSDSAAA